MGEIIIYEENSMSSIIDHLLGNQTIVRLDHVAQILPMPLSEASKQILYNTASDIIFLDRTKTGAQLVHVEDVLPLNTKLKAFIIVPSNLVVANYLQYILNTLPVNKKITDAKANRSLSAPVLSDLPIPYESLEKQKNIAKLGIYVDRLMRMTSEGDMDASLGSYFLTQVVLAINTELFFPYLCSINNLHIYEQWIMFIDSIPDDIKIISNEIIKPGNRLMAEVRSLQRVMASAQKSIQDGIQDQ